jgi:hypothetical protein
VKEWKETYQKLYERAKLVDDADALRNIVQKAHHWQQDLELRVQNQGEEIKELREEKDLLERQVGSLEEQVVERDQAVQAAYELYLDILNSNGWKLMQMLFGIRRWLIPLDSRRERIARLVLRDLRSIKAGGIKALPRGLARLARDLFRGEAAVAAPAPSPQTLNAALVPGLKVSTPGISILILQDGTMIRPDEQAIREWVSSQTYKDVDIITWDSAGCFTGPAQRLPVRRILRFAAAEFHLSRNESDRIKERIAGFYGESARARGVGY